MTTVELKTQMHQMIDAMPEAKVYEAFNYLKSVQQENPAFDKIDKIIDKIFIEDDNLLRRLAQ